MTEARGRTMPSSRKSASSPAGGIAQQLLRCAPLATWCLVGLGAATLFLGIVDNRFSTFRSEVNTRFDGVSTRFDGINTRFDGMDARLDRIEKRQKEDLQQFREEVSRRFDRLETLLVEQSGQ